MPKTASGLQGVARNTIVENPQQLQGKRHSRLILYSSQADQYMYALIKSAELVPVQKVFELFQSERRASNWRRLSALAWCSVLPAKTEFL